MSYLTRREEVLELKEIKIELLTDIDRVAIVAGDHNIFGAHLSLLSAFPPPWYRPSSLLSFSSSFYSEVDDSQCSLTNIKSRFNCRFSPDWPTGRRNAHASL